MAAAEKRKKTTYSDELLRLPVRSAPEESKFLLTKDVQRTGTVSTFRSGKSLVLDRVKGFLPQMAAAEKRLKKELETKPCSELDIENVNDDEPYIEMNLALVETGDREGSSSDEKIDSHEKEDSDVDEIKINNNTTVTEENFVIRTTKTKKQQPVIEEIKTVTNGKARKKTNKKKRRK